tara:strand:+ start:371 stop:595 length:225 start_codon:yes stop_codon:yes gene_type:complete
MKNRISKRIYKICLIILEKYDYPRCIVWNLTRKVYDKAFYGAFGYSPYSYQAMDEHDRYMDNQEYIARRSSEGK